MQIQCPNCKGYKTSPKLKILGLTLMISSIITFLVAMVSLIFHSNSFLYIWIIQMILGIYLFSKKPVYYCDLCGYKFYKKEDKDIRSKAPSRKYYGGDDDDDE